MVNTTIAFDFEQEMFYSYKRYFIVTRDVLFNVLFSQPRCYSVAWLSDKIKCNIKKFILSVSITWWFDTTLKEGWNNSKRRVKATPTRVNITPREELKQLQQVLI